MKKSSNLQEPGVLVFTGRNFNLLIDSEISNFALYKLFCLHCCKSWNVVSVNKWNEKKEMFHCFKSLLFMLFDCSSFLLKNLISSYFFHLLPMIDSWVLDLTVYQIALIFGKLGIITLSGQQRKKINTYQSKYLNLYRVCRDLS